MNNQEAFDKVATHLFNQNAQSVSGNAYNLTLRCKYRNEDGLSCAIGGLIPDELYKPEMDLGATDIVSVIRDFPEIKKLFDGVDPQLLDELQLFHDGYKEYRTNGSYLLDIAVKYELNASILQTLGYQFH